MGERAQCSKVRRGWDGSRDLGGQCRVLITSGLTLAKRRETMPLRFAQTGSSLFVPEL